MRGPILIASLVGAAMTSVIGAHGLARAQDAAPPPVEQWFMTGFALSGW